MILADIHNHSTFSTDGRSSLEDMVSTARNKGLKYFGISEHFDYDYIAAGLKIAGFEPPYTDAAAYFGMAGLIKNACREGGFTFLAGAELGYSDDGWCKEEYIKLIERYSPDFLVNSVHTVGGLDCWYKEYFEGKDKHTAYGDYLKTVRRSLDAPYNYDIVGHLGYCSRNATYADPKLRYAEFSDVIDDILKTIITRGKILEVNSSSRGAGSDFLPDCDILERYFKLGGRRVSFASDAHSTERICDRRETVAAALKKIGFEYITVPVRGKYIEVEL